MRRLPLKRLFNGINRKYFKDMLPDADVKWEKCSPGLMGECFTTLEPPLIRINPDLKDWPCMAKLVLFHEVAHLAVHKAYSGKYKGPHGPEFQAVMLRLAQDGAFKRLW